MWSFEQRNRLALEYKLLQKYGFNFTFSCPTDSERCELRGELQTSYGNSYRIRIKIPNFPERCPEVYIINPAMYDYWGKNLLEYGTSHKMHLWAPQNGEVHICLYKSEYWSNNETLTKLIMKALMWLEAYEQHRKTGFDLAYFVRSYQ